MSLATSHGSIRLCIISTHVYRRVCLTAHPCFASPPLPTHACTHPFLFFPPASFTAEVLGSLTQKLRYNRHDQFACLVATAVGGAAGQRDGGAGEMMSVG